MLWDSTKCKCVLQDENPLPETEGKDGNSEVMTTMMKRTSAVSMVEDLLWPGILVTFFVVVIKMQPKATSERKSIFWLMVCGQYRPSWWGRHGSRQDGIRSRKLTDHISTAHRKQKENRKWGEAINHQKPPPVVYFLQKGPTSEGFHNFLEQNQLGIKCSNTMGDILHSCHNIRQCCNLHDNPIIAPFHKHTVSTPRYLVISSLLQR